MAHPGSDRDPSVPPGVGPRRVARLGRRVGVALVGTAVPALVTVFSVVLAGGEASDPVSWVRGAMATPVVGATGPAWAFHVAALVGLAGVWLFGFALVVEGYFGVE